VAPRPRSSAPPDGERDRRTGARGARPPAASSPRGAPGPETGPPQAWAPPYSCATLPPAAGSPSRKRSGTGGPVVPRNRCATLGVVWTNRPHHRPRRSPRLGDCPRSEPRGSGCDFLETRSPHAGGFPGRLWLRGEDWGRGVLPGEPARERRLAPLARHGTPDPARPGLPPSPPAWPDPDSPVAGCPGEPRMVPPPAGHPSAGPCKHRTRTPPRTVPWPTSPGHRPRLVGLRAGRRRPEPERGQEAALWARTLSNHGPGGTGHGPVCWDVVLRVCSPRCCHLPCAPVARVRQTRPALSTTLPELPQE
jgi:hypothetical protein